MDNYKPKDEAERKFMESYNSISKDISMKIRAFKFQTETLPTGWIPGLK
jgi:hypothetical protein